MLGQLLAIENAGEKVVGRGMQNDSLSFYQDLVFFMMISQFAARLPPIKSLGRDWSIEARQNARSISKSFTSD